MQLFLSPKNWKANLVAVILVPLTQQNSQTPLCCGTWTLSCHTWKTVNLEIAYVPVRWGALCACPVVGKEKKRCSGILQVVSRPDGWETKSHHSKSTFAVTASHSRTIQQNHCWLCRAPTQDKVWKPVCGDHPCPHPPDFLKLNPWEISMQRLKSGLSLSSLHW